MSMGITENINYDAAMQIVNVNFINGKQFSLKFIESIGRSSYNRILERIFSINLDSLAYRLSILHDKMVLYDNAINHLNDPISMQPIYTFIKMPGGCYEEMFNAIMLNIEDILEIPLEEIFHGKVAFIE